jgi:hypothetical protein
MRGTPIAVREFRVRSEFARSPRIHSRRTPNFEFRVPARRPRQSPLPRGHRAPGTWLLGFNSELGTPYIGEEKSQSCSPVSGTASISSTAAVLPGWVTDTRRRTREVRRRGGCPQVAEVPAGAPLAPARKIVGPSMTPDPGRPERVAPLPSAPPVPGSAPLSLDGEWKTLGEAGFAASPWPAALPGLGASRRRRVRRLRRLLHRGRPDAVRDRPGRDAVRDRLELGSGTWVAYGGRPLCRSCAETRVEGRRD